MCSIMCPKHLVMHPKCSVMPPKRSMMHSNYLVVHLRAFSHVSKMFSNAFGVFNKHSTKGHCPVNGMFTILHQGAPVQILREGRIIYFWTLKKYDVFIYGMG